MYVHAYKLAEHIPGDSILILHNKRKEKYVPLLSLVRCIIFITILRIRNQRPCGRDIVSLLDEVPFTRTGCKIFKIKMSSYLLL